MALDLAGPLPPAFTQYNSSVLWQTPHIKTNRNVSHLPKTDKKHTIKKFKDALCFVFFTCCDNIVIMWKFGHECEMESDKCIWARPPFDPRFIVVHHSHQIHPEVQILCFNANNIDSKCIQSLCVCLFVLKPDHYYHYFDIYTRRGKWPLQSNIKMYAVNADISFARAQKRLICHQFLCKTS